MTAPVEYDQLLIQQELDSLRETLRIMTQYLSLIPLPTAPVSPSNGWLALSDGTGSGFDSASGMGLYRYSGSSWVFVG